MDQINFLLHINEEFDAIPWDQLSKEARSACLSGKLTMAISTAETTGSRFLSASRHWIRAAELVGIDVDKIRKEFEEGKWDHLK